MHNDLRVRVWPALISAVAALLIVTLAGFLIVADPAWSAGELRLIAAAHASPNALFDIVALTVNISLGPMGAPLVAVLVLGGIQLGTGSWRRTATAAVVLGVPWVCAELLKDVVQRPRPGATALAITDPTSFSYPSGHTAFAVALACAVAFALITRRAKAIAVVAGAILVVVTAWSRVYLGVHYPTDVVASIVLVPFLAVAVHRVLQRWLQPAARSAQPQLVSGG